MTMRIQEIHPALVHFPITLLPFTIATDTVGRITGNEPLLRAGRIGILAVSGAAAAAAAAGLLAQESARYDGDSRDLLTTHRNLNLGLIGLTAWMASRRARKEVPSIRYLAAGLAGIGVMTYSAYLGGHMVYERGVGVSRAGGLQEGEAPELVPERLDEVMATAGRHLKSGLREAIRALTHGEIVPWLTRRTERQERLATHVAIEREPTWVGEMEEEGVGAGR